TLFRFASRLLRCADLARAFCQLLVALLVVRCADLACSASCLLCGADVASKRNIANSRAKERLEMMKEWMYEKRLSRPLRRSCREYFTELYNHKSVFDETKILQLLPTNLAHKVRLHLNEAIFKTIPAFQNEPPPVIFEMCTRLQARFFAPKQTLIDSDEPSEGIFFLITGMVEVLLRSEAGSLNPIKTLHTGSYFGSFALLQGMQRKTAVVALTHCNTFLLSHQAMDTIKAEYPAIEQRMRMLFGLDKFQGPASQSKMDVDTDAASGFSGGESVPVRTRAFTISVDSSGFSNGGSFSTEEETIQEAEKPPSSPTQVAKVHSPNKLDILKQKRERMQTR
ncbi:hypothetical protein CYMTET_38777, partial [Cymbomonas tetramitiformis]